MKAHPDFDRLMARLKTHILGDRLFPRQLANTLWALAKMGLNEDEYIEAVFEQMQRVSHAYILSQGATSRAGTPILLPVLRTPKRTQDLRGGPVRKLSSGGRGGLSMFE